MTAPRGSASLPRDDLGPFSSRDGLTVRVLRQIDDIPAADWDALTGSRAVVRSHAYLRAIAAARLNDCRYYYPVVHGADGRLLAHCCVYVITTDLLQILPRRLQGPARWLRRLWPGFLQVRIAECATPHVIGQSFSLAPDAPREELLRALEQAIARIAEHASCPLVVVRDFRQDELGELAAFTSAGYATVSNMPMSRIRIRWSSYADFLADMKSRYRKDLGRRLRRAAEAGRSIRALQGFSELAEACSEQVEGAYARSQGIRRERLGPDYYRAIDSCLRQQSRLLVAEEAGRMVGHGLLLLDDAHVVAAWSGREEGPPGDIWFTLLDAAVRLAIERRAEWLNLGLGTYAAKSLLGAEVEPLFCLVRSRYRLANFFMRRVPHTMAKSPPAVHHVFRSPAEPVGEKTRQV